MLTDYKFFCFDGIPRVMYISDDKGENPTTDFFDMDFNHLDLLMRDQNSKEDNLPQRPINLEKMKIIARELSKGVPHLRVDLKNLE